MNVIELRDALDDLAGPAPHPTAAQRAAVTRRVSRSRLARTIGAVAIAIVAIVGIGLVAQPWRDDEPTRVVTSFGTTIHDEKLGYTVTIPPGWVHHPVHVRKGEELPGILDLTYDYTGIALGADCAGAGTQVGIAIGVQERNDVRTQQSKFPPLRRPPVIGRDTDGGLHTNTYPPVCGRLEQFISFQENGRSFSIGMTMGPDTAPARKAEAYAILNSLRFDRGTFVEKVRGAGVSTTTVTSVR